MNVLIITTEWPTVEHPYAVPFLVQHVEFLKSEGIDVNVYHIQGKGNFLKYIKAWVDIRKQDIWYEADIVHAHWGQSALLALFSKKKLVITFHGSDLQGIVSPAGNYSIKGKALVFLSKIISRRANACIVVSDHMKDYLPKSLKKIYTIPIGIDIELFHPMDQKECRNTLKIRGHKKIVLFVGDPKRPEKRFDLAQKVVETYKKKYQNNIQLLVVNGVCHRDMPIYLNAGDVLLITSLHEGSPTVVKEALACNLPIVSTDVGDVRKNLGEISGCYISKKGNPDSLANGLNLVINNVENFEGRKISRKFDERKLVKRIILIYESIVQNTL